MSEIPTGSAGGVKNGGERLAFLQPRHDYLIGVSCSQQGGNAFPQVGNATAVDYDPRSDLSVAFFKIVQNKLHFAAHGHTAAEVIFERADAEKDFMGMSNFKGDWPTLRDAKIAKNYLTSDELKILNNIVSGYFDFAEIQALRHNPMYMQDYIRQLDAILSSTGEQLLQDAGKISHDEAMQKAETEYRKWQVYAISPVEQAYLDSIKALKEMGDDMKKSQK